MAKDNLNAPVEYAGMLWPRLMPPVVREIECIRRGGSWVKRTGGKAGLGLYEHYLNLMRYLWGDMEQHRWMKLMVKEYLDSILLSVIGPANSSKTQTMAMLALADYICFPHETLCIVSSTNVRGLELRVYGAIKSLHGDAKRRFPDLIPGHFIDSKHALCTDNIEEDEVRDMRRGIIAIPCLGSQGQWTGGLQNFVGIKQKRRRLFSDEASFMKQPFLDALANLNTGDFKGMFIGNPLGDGDPLDKLAEPMDGWSTQPEPKTTTCWNTRDVGGRCINLIGTDSPNFDYPQDQPPRYPFLIHKEHFDRVIARWGERDWHYYQQCLGVRITGIEAKKVITRDLCYQWHALEQVFWLNENRKKAYAVDAAYGNLGGDRCVGGFVEWGKDVAGIIRLRVNNPVIIPVRPAKMAGIEPEYQIARFVRGECEREGIPPSSVFYDATGRGSLGTAFAREWSADVNPIEFGGAPSERPVTSEMTIQDPKTREMRLMTAKERFSKFVTELWWSVRYVIEADQMRELPNEVMDEGTRRLWRMTKGNKIEIETKDEMKERIGYSPDLFDWLATCVEGARRMGFNIASMTAGTPPKRQEMMNDLLRKAKERTRSYTLNYS